MEDEPRNKAHKAKTVGNKAAKRDEIRKKRAGIDLQPNRGNNIKAFQGPSSGSHKAQKFLRSVEKRETALHLPTMDKTLRHIVAEPPLLVAVVGPPGVGKTTLIRSMVKFYSNRNLQSVRGPVSVIAGKSRRITFVECPNTLTAMCDVAKVADLILLMVDGSFGFEMETFEFLNIAQVHGFPKMFGVVSHLDQLKTGKALKKRKKFLRHRFWHEVAAGAKLMCLSPMVRGYYRPTDVLNLHRLLICVEPKIQSWRNTHSCVVIDRQEDITDPDTVTANPKCSRTVAFYGYARGKPIKPGQLLHIPGLGDFPIQHISHQDDPCQLEKFGEGKSQGHRMRHLSAKQKQLYAPYCDVGGITYDDDAIYVQEDADMANIERSGEGLQLLRELQRAQPIDVSKTRLEVVRRPVVFRDEDAMELDMADVRMPSDGEDNEDSDEDYEDYEDGKHNSLAQFGLPEDDMEDKFGEEEGGETAGGLAPRMRNDPDSIRLNIPQHDWESDMSLLRRLKDLCVTGNWRSGDEEGEDGEEGDETGSRGYDSNDEDFEAEARGEKAALTHMQPSSDDNDEDGGVNYEGDSDDERKLGDDVAPPLSSSSASRKTDALASIGYGSSSAGSTSRTSGKKGGGDGESSWGAFGFHGSGGDAAWRGRHHGRDDGKDDDADSDGYDILAEGTHGDGGEASGADGHNEGDDELNGLVAQFLSTEQQQKQRKAAAAANSEMMRAEEDGIQFYEKDAHLRRHGAVDDREEAMMSEAVVHGSKLSEEQERILQRKMDKKKAFDEEYDAVGGGGKSMTYSYYNKLNRKIEEKKDKIDEALNDVGDDVEKKIQLVGYFSGLYVRFVLENIPAEFLQLFDPTNPLIAGGVNAGEDEFRIVHARVKRHRWYPKILKAQDPVLLSMGWRRFQTQPIYALEDPNGRCRYLKYTPLHMHCMAAFYAPVAPPNTGFLAIPVKDNRTLNFRISCTGYTVGNDVVSSVVKKLKLTGTPAKIEKTTVFVKGMFTSDIEAAKFVGAKLKSVSGVRGIIKSVLKGKQGLVRATFEDKLFPSDIVFIRAWKSVEPPRYCSIQRNLIDKNWAGMRTMRELRWDHGVPLQQNPDSEYRDIKRRNRLADDEGPDGEQKVLISRNMKMQLPFDMKEEFIPLAKTNELHDRLKAATTVAPEPREQRRQALLDTFADRADVMTRKKNEARKRARDRQEKEASKENEKYLEGLKKAKKETARRAEFRTQHKSRKH